MDCYEYLRRLPPIALDRLYRCEWSCRAVFQSLSPLAQQYAARLLCVTAPLSRTALEQWVDQKAAASHRNAVAQLLGLRFLIDEGSSADDGGMDLTADADEDLFGVDSDEDDVGRGRRGDVATPGIARDVRLNPAVQATLMGALSSAATAPWTQPPLAVPGSARAKKAVDKHPPTVEGLGTWARERWERLLYYMVDATFVRADLRDTAEEQARMARIVALLYRSGLMVARDEAGAARAGDGAPAHALSPRGFEFMLCSQATQLWLFLREYLDAGEAGGASSGGAGLEGSHAAVAADAAAADAADAAVPARRLPADRVLGMLFRLAHCVVGEAVGVASLAEGERALLGELSDVGLLYVKERAGVFYATPLASLLVFGGGGRGTGGGGCGGGGGSGGSSSAAAGAADAVSGEVGAAGGKSEELDGGGAVGGSGLALSLSLIVETNFKVYAFTRSLLDARLLAYFVEVQYRLPDVCVGEITRESAQDAFRAGITARQIIAFLDNHAHVHAQGRSPVTPDNVKDQLQLWENENKRFVPKPGVLYHKFADDEEFFEFRDYAKDLHVLLWSSAKSRKMCVTERGHEQMRAFSRAKKKRKLAAATAGR